MNGFLTKPFKGRELLSLVETSSRSSSDDEIDEIIEVDQVDETRPPVDIDGFRAAMREMGIEEVVEKSVAAYRAEMPGRMERLTQALAANDLAEIGSVAHAMKSASGAIYATTLAAFMEKLENIGKDGDTEAAMRLVPEAQAEFEDVMTYLRVQGIGDS